MEDSMTRYVALIDGRHGAYGVVVPDLPGCTSAGKTTDQAYRNAMEAVRLWIEDAEADGEKLPRPRTLEALRADPEIAAALAEGAAIAIVPVLQAIDEAAEAHGLTRSAFIASAAREKIKEGA